MKQLRIVVLRFADEIRVDLVNYTLSEGAAIGAFVAECLASSHPPRLPLIEAKTAIVPADRLALLLNGIDDAAAAISATIIHPIPIAGLHSAMRSYWGRAISGATQETILEARSDLCRFFYHYNTKITFTDGRSDLWETPTEAWKGE